MEDKTQQGLLWARPLILLFAFNSLPSCPKLAAASSRLAADISKLERDKAVNVLASFSVAVERPCPSSACKASPVTELCLSHAHSSEVASHLPLGFTWESAIANPHIFGDGIHLCTVSLP